MKELTAQKTNEVVDFARSKDGGIYCALRSVEDSEQITDIREVDTTDCKWGRKLKLEAQLNTDTGCLADGLTYDFYYKDYDGIWGYTIQDRRSVKLLDYGTSYLTAEDTGSMVAVDENDFAGMMDNGSGERKLYLYQKETETSGKQVITYGTTNVSDALIRAARQFNQENAEYKLVFREYETEESDDSRVYAQLTTGDVPDIIDVSCLGLSVEQCIAKGLLADLTPYYERDDTVSMEELIPSVLESMKTDGKLYFLSRYFTLSTVAGKTSDVGTGTGWTMQEMQSVLAKKGDCVLPFSPCGKEEMLQSFLLTGLTDYVDWEEGTCRFDTSEFREILEICNRGNDESDETNAFSELQNGSILLKAYEDGFSVQDVQRDRQIFGEDVTYIGYPNADREGSYFTFNDAVGIYAQSEVKEMAWKFLRTIVSKEYQGEKTLQLYVGMPTRQDCFDLRMRQWTATEAYTDLFGQEIEPLEQTAFYAGDIEIKTGPVSQADADTYRSVVENTHRRAATQTEQILSILLEEADAYFDGKKQMDETIQLMEERAETYLHEQQ